MIYMITQARDFALYGEVCKKELYIHLELQASKWTASVYKRMLEDFAEIITELSNKGVKRLFVILEKTDTKTQKFDAGFGFLPDKEFDDHIRLRLDL